MSDTVHEMIMKITENLKFPNLIVAFSHSDYISSLGGTEKVLHEEQMEYEKRGISYIQVYGAVSRENGHQEEPPSASKVGLTNFRTEGHSSPKSHMMAEGRSEKTRISTG